MDQSVIKIFTAHYRNMIMQKILVVLEANDDATAVHLAKRFSPLDWFFFIASNWNQVPDHALRKCFDRGRVFAGDTRYTDDDNKLVLSIFVPPAADFSQDLFDEFVDTNAQSATFAPVIIDQVLPEGTKKTERSDSDQEDADEEPTASPTMSPALKAFGDLRSFDEIPVWGPLWYWTESFEIALLNVASVYHFWFFQVNFVLSSVNLVLACGLLLHAIIRSCA